MGCACIDINIDALYNMAILFHILLVFEFPSRHTFHALNIGLLPHPIKLLIAPTSLNFFIIGSLLDQDIDYGLNDQKN